MSLPRTMNPYQIAEINKLRTNLAVVTKQLNDAQAELIAKSAAIDELNTKNAELITQKQNEEPLNKANEEIATLKVTIEKHIENEQNLTNEKRAIQTLLNQANEAIRKSKDQVRKTEITYEELANEKEGTQTLLNQANKNLKTLKEDYDRLVQTTDDLENKNNMVETAYNHLAISRNDLETSYKKASEELAQLRTENFALIQTVKTLQQAVVSKDAELGELKHPNVFLLNSAARGDLDNVKLAIEGEEKKADIEATDPQTNATALFLSVLNNHLDVVKYLINSKASMEVADKDDKKLLEVAVTQSNSDIANFIISHYPKRDGGEALKAAYELATDDKVKHHILNNLLLQAAKQNLLELAEFALKNGADVDASDDVETALHKACYYGHTQIVKLLMRHNCNVDLKDNTYSKSIAKRLATKEEIKQLFDHYARLKQEVPAMIHGFFSRKEFVAQQAVEAQKQLEFKNQTIDDANELMPKLMAEKNYKVAQELLAALDGDNLKDILKITTAYRKDQADQDQQPKQSKLN